MKVKAGSSKKNKTKKVETKNVSLTKEMTVNIEKIENGYLVRKSGPHGPNGEWQSKTWFSKEEPKLDIPTE